MPRKQQTSDDPIFAEEMKAKEREHNAAIRERLAQPATTTPRELPPIHKSVLGKKPE